LPSSGRMKKKRDRRKDPFKKMIALGESTTAGGSATAVDLCWVNLLADLINQFQDQKMEFVNKGIGANVISPNSISYKVSGQPSALERVERDVIEEEPDLVVISYGLNDIRCGTLIEVFKADMGILIRRIREELPYCLVVLVNVYFMTNFQQGGHAWSKGNREKTELYNLAIRQIAEMHDLPYADVYDAQGCAEWVVDIDGVHANNLGHRLIANRIFGVIAKNCSCLAVKAFREAESYPKWRDESVLQKPIGSVTSNCNLP